AGGAERQHGGAGQEVVEGLLLDRVEAEAGRSPVGGQRDLVVLAGAHEAEAPLALVQLAVARTDVTLDAAVRQRVPMATGNAFQSSLVGHRLAPRGQHGAAVP